MNWTAEHLTATKMTGVVDCIIALIAIWLPFIKGRAYSYYGVVASEQFSLPEILYEMGFGAVGTILIGLLILCILAAMIFLFLNISILVAIFSNILIVVVVLVVMIRFGAASSRIKLELSWGFYIY